MSASLAVAGDAVYLGQVVQGAGPALAVAERGEVGQRLADVAGGLRGGADVAVYRAEMAAHQRDRPPVADPRRRVEPDLLDLQVVLVVPQPPERLEHRLGQPPGGVVRAGLLRQPYDRDQRTALGLEPRARRGRIGRHAQVVVEQPDPGLAHACLRVPAQLPGQPLDQVVHAIARLGHRLHQVRPVQPLDRDHRLADGAAQRGGQHLGREIAAGQEPDVPERAPLRRRQRLVGQVERGPEGVLRITGQRLPLAGAAQLVYARLDAQPGVLGELGRRDAQRERVVRADPGQLGQRVAVGGPWRLLAEHRDQQRDGVARVEDGQVHQVGVPGRAQRRHPGPAGHQHHAVLAAGQQRPHLGRIGGVVQNEQQLPPGQPAAIEQHQLGLVGGGHVLADAERAQDLPERLGRVHGWLAGGLPAQVDHDLPVGEPGRLLVRPARHERRLPHAGKPLHDHRVRAARPVQP